MTKAVDTLDSRLSDVIKAMRFPLIALVLLAHSVGNAPVGFHWPLDGSGGFYFVSEMLSHHLCPIAVCWFFVFSGYFFFRNLKDGDFCATWVIGKWKKRIRSLLIPFMFWNCLVVVLTFLTTTLYGWAGIVSTSDAMSVVRRGPLYWLFTGPADYPLWFMRDLIIMTILTPVIYYTEKYAPFLSLTLLLLFYLSTISPAYPAYRSIFFFGLGAWLGIHRYNILHICRVIRVPATVAAFVLLPLSTAMMGHEVHELLRRLFYPFGMITMMNLCDRWVDRESIKQCLFKLSSSVFFVYAAHEVFILGWTKGAFLRIFGNALSGMWISYISVPIVVMFICLALYHMLNKLAPKVLAFACGGRS